KTKLTVTIEGAIIAALAMALTYLPHTIGLSFQFQYGIIPLVIYAWRRGFRAGVSAGVVWGLLDLVLRGLSKGEIVNIWQGLLEYPIAFGVLGIAGLWSHQIQMSIDNKTRQFSFMLLSCLIAVFSKYFCHFIAGGIVWGIYAPKSMNPWVYSLLTNGGSAVVNVVM
ncbi:energy-coupled thiamine transporter ThiT, partial [Lactobacillus sp. XV13L]|nr:energy-coupled thiamine transporter ThiT [Lactobacillus sp. XV13L]